MTRRTRRIFFYALLILFLITGTAIISYAQGYRFNFSTFKVAKVGAIFIRSFPAEAQIYLDGEPVKNRSGFFQPGTLVNDLFPQKYHLELRQPGYKTMERTVEVKPSLVTELKYAVLIPEKSSVALATPAKNFWMFSDILIQDSKGDLRLSDFKLPGQQVLAWTGNLEHLITLDPRSSVYYLNDLRNSTSTNLNLKLRQFGIKIDSSTKISVNPDSNPQLLITTPSSLQVLDLQRNILVPVNQNSPEEITSFAASNFWISWSLFNKRTGTSTIMNYDKFFGTERVLSNNLTSKTVKMKWLDNNLLGIGQDNGDFYIIRPGEDLLTQVASDVRDFEYSKERNNLAVLEKNAIEVFNLNDKKEYFRFVLPEMEMVSRIEWYENGMNLFVIYPNKTMFLALEDKLLENYLLLTGTSKVEYDEGKNHLYYLDTDKILRIDFPK